MCFGGGGRPPSPPKPPPLQKVVAPPPPPAPPPAPKQLQQPDAKPDLRIGSQKSTTTSRSKVSAGSLKSSLSMGGDNKGINL